MRYARKSDVVAVVVAAGLLLGAATDRLSLPRPADAADYHARVREEAERAPMRIGAWIGSELAIPPEAVAQLRPNVLLSRRYVDTATGRAVSLVLVQCGDIRDLVPHYPPVCYPGRGLQLTSSQLVKRAVGTLNVEATRYEFESNTFHRATKVSVDNFMILPDGRIKPDTEGMEREIGMSQRYFGAAQVQLVSEGDVPVAQRDAVLHEILAAYEPLIKAISRGVGQ